ncbi:MAG: deoxynucleoside kinase [Chloroflexi bacterium]|nr:deoxynucleoside kinase [Chloroflexota bacterium]
MKHYLVIAGNIGVGKSTLVKVMHERLQWEPFYEAVVENPYLADFYADMPRWAFHSQMFFLTRRLHSHHQLLLHPGVVVQDRSVYEDAEIFARNLFLQGRMSTRDYATYSDMYEVLKLFLPPPHLVVYLQASVDTLLKRIALRGRDYEKGIERMYLEQLNRLYEEWIQNFQLAPVLTVPADRLDFVQYDRDLQMILDKVQQKLRGDQYVLFE